MRSGRERHAELPATTLERLTGHTDAGFTLLVYASDARDFSDEELRGVARVLGLPGYCDAAHVIPGVGVYVEE